MKRLAILSMTVALVLMSSAARAASDDRDDKNADTNDTIALDQAATSTPATVTPITDSLAEQAARLAADPQGARPVAIEYSDAHETRAKIHRYVSWAVLPLMATEFALGQSLYNDPNSTTSNLRGVHGAVGAGLIGVFAAQSVTGVWNLLEEGGAPGQKKRLVHGFMMLAA